MSDMIRFSGRCEIEAAAGDKPKRLQVLAYSGGVMTVDGFGSVVIDLAGMALPTSIPVLSDHKNELSSIVASGVPVIRTGTLGIVATLADSDAARSVVSLLSSGVQLQASIGANPTQRRYIKSGENVHVNGRMIKASDGGFSLIEKSTLKEISITPVGADGNTSVSLAAKLSGAAAMTETEILQAERHRVAKIEAAFGSADSLPEECRKQAAELRATAIAGLIGVEELQAGLLGLLRASRPSVGISTSGGSRPAADIKAVLSASLMVRAGYHDAAEKEYGAGVMQASQHLHNASLVDLCRTSLEADGRDVPRHRSEMIRAAISTGSMPIALGDSANRIMATVYRTAPASWRQFAAVKSAADFRTNKSVRPSFAADLEELPPGGEIKHGHFGEEVYSWSVATFARQLGIDRTDIINDNVGVFSEIIPSLAKAASRTLSGLVAKTILANTGGFWSTGNKNYQEGSGTALSATSLASAIKLLRQMKDSENNVLDLSPHVLLVPPELEQTAKALVMSADMQRYVASGVDQVPMGNPMLNVASVVVEPRLGDSSFAGYSATAWYLFSEPSNAACVVGFLDGREAPVLEQFGLDSNINYLSYGFRCYHDFGVALADPRSSIKSKGVA